MFKELLQSVGELAPQLVKAATGSHVSLVLSLARKITGKKDGSADDVAAALIDNPQLLATFRQELARMELAEVEARLADTADARAQHRESHAPAIVSGIVAAAFAAAVLVILFVEVPTGSRNLAYLLLGMLGAMTQQACNYWLGSSQGSKAKTAIIQAFGSAARSDQEARRRGD